MSQLQKQLLVIALGMLSIGILVGYLVFGNSEATESTEIHDHGETVSGIPQIFTCSMHPQIRQGEPGDCPICGMDLIPLEVENSETSDPLAISMSPSAMKLAGVQTMIVGNSDGGKMLRLNGKIQADERSNYTQSAHIAGRIENLAVTFTGEYVNKGQVIGQIYSPNLVTAQEELLQAQKIKDSQPALYNAARSKLKNWKFTDTQIDEMLAKGTVSDQIPLLANISGYVTEKMVNQGDYVQRGQAIFQIADLSRVWVLFDLYESELNWVKKGEKVSYSIQSLPGEEFSGIVSYVDPVINPQTRVAQARVEVTNSDLKLKPEMFVSGVIESEGISSEDQRLVVPKSAVMWTGKRSIVYVKNTNSQGVSFILREVVLGNAMGDSFEIESGLKSGEEIASNGTFSIDAAAQLSGKPSMMSPEGGTAMTGHDHSQMSGTSNPETISSVEVSDEAKTVLAPVYTDYLELKDALTTDSFENAKAKASQMKKSLNRVSMGLFDGDSHTYWMDFQSQMNETLALAETSKDIEFLRKNFQTISNEMVRMTEQLHAYSGKLYVQHCPMADGNKGADWLSLESNIVNPYFGKSMLTCGEVTKTIE